VLFQLAMGPFTFSIEVQSNLGVIYANGEGVPEDDAEAGR